MGQGAAVEDGRLRPGDRLLEIDGAPVTGLSQQQVVQMLRSVRPSQPVHLVLSRHELEEGTAKKESDGSPKLPRPLVSAPSRLRRVQSAPSHSLFKSKVLARLACVFYVALGIICGSVLCYRNRVCFICI